MDSTRTNNIASITYELNDALKDLACREIRANARFTNLVTIIALTMT